MSGRAFRAVAAYAFVWKHADVALFLPCLSEMLYIDQSKKTGAKHAGNEQRVLAVDGCGLRADEEISANAL